MNSKKKAILDRNKHLEDAIAKGNEYLESEKHADWHGFRPMFVIKIRDGKVLPPHKDWVKNVFLPRHEKALRRAQKTLETFDLVRSAHQTKTRTRYKTGEPDDEANDRGGRRLS